MPFHSSSVQARTAEPEPLHLASPGQMTTRLTTRLTDVFDRHVCPAQVQSFDQEFESMNKALKLSCIKGLPVRVVRSFKVRRRHASCCTVECGLLEVWKCGLRS